MVHQTSFLTQRIFHSWFFLQFGCWRKQENWLSFIGSSIIFYWSPGNLIHIRFVFLWNTNLFQNGFLSMQVVRKKNVYSYFFDNNITWHRFDFRRLLRAVKESPVARRDRVDTRSATWATVQTTLSEQAATVEVAPVDLSKLLWPRFLLPPPRAPPRQS